MTTLGFRYHRRGWRIFSQVLTAGGVVLLYLSAYAAFGYYHLATQKAAFAFLTILVAEAAALAYLYNAPAIAIMALIGGFLAPILLRSEHDQYRSLFGYIALLDIGTLAVLKTWRGLISIAFVGTHFLFWLWYGEHYHPRKLFAVMLFQIAVFLIFLLAHLGRRLFLEARSSVEDLVLLGLNPFVFFITAYHLLNPNHHDWMGVFAILMALVFAGATKLLMSRNISGGESLTMIAVALTFLTIAMPIQLRTNWITIGWAAEALVMLWVGLEIRSSRLRVMAYTLFGLALLRLLLWDTPKHSYAQFTPIANKYFLSSLIVVGSLFGATWLFRTIGARKQIGGARVSAVFSLLAIAAFWFIMSVETALYFSNRAAAQQLLEAARHEEWLGQMSLSVLWSLYAGVLAAIGLVRRAAAVRWAALVLFTWTIIKAMLIDIAQLQQLYRIVALLVLGLLLLAVAWGYHKAYQASRA